MTTACPIDYAYQDAKQMAFFLAKPVAFKPIYDEIARKRIFPFTIGHRVLFGLGSGARLSVVALLAFAQQAARLDSLKDQSAEWCNRYSRAYWLMLTTYAEDLLDRSRKSAKSTTSTAGRCMTIPFPPQQNRIGDSEKHHAAAFFVLSASKLTTR